MAYIYASACIWPGGKCALRWRNFSSWCRSSASRPTPIRSEEHTSELQSLMRISYAVFCLKKKKYNKNKNNTKRKMKQSISKNQVSDTRQTPTYTVTRTNSTTTQLTIDK